MIGAQQRTATDIDLWTRAFAAEQAQQAGMSVRAWLDEFIARETAGAAHGPDLGSAAHEASTSDHRASDEPTTCWSPARDAFGQRSHRPEARHAVEPAQVSAAAILARAVDDVDPIGPERARELVLSEPLPAELGIRARVSQAGANARRRLENDEIELLLNAPADPATSLETGSHAALSEIERALREMREQMDAAVQLSEAAATAPPGVAATPQGAPSSEASTEAIANLGLDIGRLVDVMDCGFERIEAASARQSLELRSEVSEMFDELASRIERFERQSAAPAPEATAETVAEPVIESAHGRSLETDWREVDCGPAPSGDASDEAPLVDAAAQALDWQPSALPAPAEPDLPEQAPEASAVEVPGAELFEDPSALAGLVEPEPPADRSDVLDWPELASAARPMTEMDRPLEAQHDDLDDDALADDDLFNTPPKGDSEAAANDGGADTALTDCFAWPPAEPQPAAADHDVWFGPGSHKLEGKPAPDQATHDANVDVARTDPFAWPRAEPQPTAADHDPWCGPGSHKLEGEPTPDAAPDQTEITVTRFDPIDQARDDAAAAADGGKRVRFPWLLGRRGGQSRKSA
jgi:hypothetical protein